nr:MAG TPA: hypothetical protein [Inoviridae sp.]
MVCNFSLFPSRFLTKNFSKFYLKILKFALRGLKFI